MAKSVPDKIQKVLERLVEETPKYNNKDVIKAIVRIHTDILLKIIEEDVIGEDKKHAPVDTLGIWSHDIANFEYNQLRAEQRSKLK